MTLRKAMEDKEPTYIVQTLTRIYVITFSLLS